MATVDQQDSPAGLVETAHFYTSERGWIRGTEVKTTVTRHPEHGLVLNVSSDADVRLQGEPIVRLEQAVAALRNHEDTGDHELGESDNWHQTREWLLEAVADAAEQMLVPKKEN